MCFSSLLGSRGSSLAWTDHQCTVLHICEAQLGQDIGSLPTENPPMFGMSAVGILHLCSTNHPKREMPLRRIHSSGRKYNRSAQPDPARSLAGQGIKLDLSTIASRGRLRALRAPHRLGRGGPGRSCRGVAPGDEDVVRAEALRAKRDMNCSPMGERDTGSMVN
jgi:hypothetical protein